MIPVTDHSALIVVDLQNDFCPGGSLPVPQGNDVVPVIQALIGAFSAGGQPIALTRDHHPADHISFQSRGGPWPPHCVVGTHGFDYHPDLVVPSRAAHFIKGFTRDRDAYSGFEGIRIGPGGEMIGENLADYLHHHGVETVYLTGLATDYCVRATALDALREGFTTWVVVDAIRGVDVKSGDSQRALLELAEKGAGLIESAR